MKFRNTETGEVFDLTHDDCVTSGFCRGIYCLDCPIFGKIPSSCSTWINDYPHEAAHLMGYEAV